jgi:hypothetical protein
MRPCTLYMQLEVLLTFGKDVTADALGAVQRTGCWGTPAAHAQEYQRRPHALSRGVDVRQPGAPPPCSPVQARRPFASRRTNFTRLLRDVGTAALRGGYKVEPI